MLSIIKSLTKRQKRMIMLTLDSLLIVCATIFALAVRGLPEHFLDTLGGYAPVLPITVIVGIFVSIRLGVCSTQLNAYETAAVGSTAILATILSAVSLLSASVLELDFPLGVHIMFGAIFFSLVVLSRVVLLHIVLKIYRLGDGRCRVLIYGAGTTGTQLVSALRGHEIIEPIAFVDDNIGLQGLNVSKLPVYSPLGIAELVVEKQIDRVLLAVPSLSTPKQAQIARRLEKLGLEVQTLPSFAQL
ncbi:MAG: polysaccharide biosynthesis protein, partial [Paracoccaceae bacterium]